MAIFQRNLNSAHLSEDSVDQNHWFRELLKLWRPSGVQSDIGENGKSASLRLAIRDGYMNFYGAGQSVARVESTRDCFREEVHYKYLGIALTSSGYAFPPKPSSELAEQLLANRIAMVSKWHAAEKTFVDQLMGDNADIFDLELSLSFMKPGATRAVALRLDAASLERNGEGWRIVLWEAKMANNDEAKAKGDADPKTRQQHQNYLAYFAKPGAVDDFIAATRVACINLVKLRYLAEHAGNKQTLGEGIMAVGQDTVGKVHLTLDTNVRYIIDVRGDKSGAFTTNGHVDKLRAMGAHVQTIDNDSTSLALDKL
ncbi:hypothetical protein [Loktanella salsilacus]|uniref:hypothetical protein n=1 Tax=Loktanella salsilacus TaxID=195913 RepID=UPI003734E109